LAGGLIAEIQLVAQAGAEISAASLSAVLDAVRTAVLDWAIEMERARSYQPAICVRAENLVPPALKHT
jgi:hypothetical protein